MHATDIVAYTYQAENLCPACTLAAVAPGFDVPGSLSTEAALEFIAKGLSLDYHDMSSYDSHDFPKPVFASQVEDVEHCGSCGEEIAA